jgi:hypothetical protein
MDLFGKILVFVNLGLSLMMAAVGGAMLYYRVDWSDAPATADTPAGELLGREEKLDVLRGKATGNSRQPGQIDAACVAWRDAQSALVAREEQNAKDRQWYVEQLEALRTNPKNQPIQALVYDKGRTVPNPNNGMLPQLAPVADRYGQALLSLKAYAAALADMNDKVAKKAKEVDDLVKKDDELTARLLGTNNPAVKPKPGDKPTRGLIERIKDEQDKQADLAKEQELVLLAEGQVRADSQLLLARKKSLETRVKELEKAAVTATKP